MKQVSFYHECAGRSEYHREKYRHWAKRITSVDTSKANGFAFEGEFLSVWKENLVPVDSIIVTVCGSALTAYYISPTGKWRKKIAEGSYRSFPTFIKDIASFFKRIKEKK